MKRESLAILLAVASLNLSSGCASSGLLSALSRPMAAFRPKPDAADVSSESVADSKTRKRRKADDEDALSPEFKEAQKTFKHTQQTMLAWARYQEDVGEYAEARKKYRELLIAYPENTEASLGLARIEQVTGRALQAEEILTDLEQRHPDDVVVKLELGRMYSQQEMWPEALSKFEQAAEIDPEDQTCRYELGVALARAHRFDSALSHLTFAVGVPAANYNIGYILHEEGNNRDAIEWFRNALQSHPDQQTSEKTQSMLAKLLPAAERDQKSAAIARYQAQNGAARNAVSRQSSSGNTAAQFSPVDLSDSDRGLPLPVVDGHYNQDGYPLPPAVASHSPAAQSAIRGDDSSIRGVSYSGDAAATGRAVYSDGSQPLPWSGPASSSAPSAVRTPSVQEPPLWRAHGN